MLTMTFPPLVKFTGQTGATRLASSTPTWTAPTAGSSQTHTCSGLMASQLTTPAAACTGWMPNIMSLRRPTWMDTTARLSLAKVNSHQLLYLFWLFGSEPPVEHVFVLNHTVFKFLLSCFIMLFLYDLEILVFILNARNSGPHRMI